MSGGGLTGGIYKPLSPEQVELIHAEALRLLEEVGMTYESGQDDMLAMVKHAGCRVDQRADHDGLCRGPPALCGQQALPRTGTDGAGS